MTCAIGLIIGLGGDVGFSYDGHTGVLELIVKAGLFVGAYGKISLYMDEIFGL